MTTEEQGPESGPDSEAKRPAPITAPKGRRAPDAPTVEAALTPSGEALAALLPDVLAPFELEIGADIDEVVCRVAPEHVAEVCAALKSDTRTFMKYLRLITVVDYEENDQEFEVVYHLYSLEHQHKMVLKARVPAADPALPTVTTVWRGADWYEREMHDLFGVVFSGHPNLVTLILPDGFEGYPGRKSYPLHDYDEW
ncbi:MAG: NADH-quinone oxidoreductase subunit C [Chloroflexi bacterium]|nr:NADH-quinone oxidoreductase subunit C [Chloroflexota bacterium]